MIKSALTFALLSISGIMSAADIPYVPESEYIGSQELQNVLDKHGISMETFEKQDYFYGSERDNYTYEDGSTHLDIIQEVLKQKGTSIEEAAKRYKDMIAENNRKAEERLKAEAEDLENEKLNSW